MTSNARRAQLHRSDLKGDFSACIRFAELPIPYDHQSAIVRSITVRRSCPSAEAFHLTDERRHRCRVCLVGCALSGVP